MSYVLCELEAFFDEELDQSMHRVSRPLQVFATKEEALSAEELFCSFYDYNLHVVESTQLKTTFR